jgi:ketosteroid isomerase-like protein
VAGAQRRGDAADDRPGVVMKRRRRPSEPGWDWRRPRSRDDLSWRKSRIDRCPAAFGRGDIPYILDRLDPAVEWRSPGTVPFSKGLYRGPEEVAQFFAGITEYIAEPNLEAHEFLAVGDRVVALLRFRGRGKETGLPFDAPEAHIWRLSEGKVVEQQTYADTAAIVQALGTEVSIA